MPFTARADIKAVLVAYSGGTTYASNAELSGEPVIRTNSDAESTNAHGKIILDDESLNQLENKGSDHENMHYRCPIRFQFDDQTTETKLKALMEETRKAFNVNNKLPNPKYHLQLLYTWDGVIQATEVLTYVEAVEVFASL